MLMDCANDVCVKTMDSEWVSYIYTQHRSLLTAREYLFRQGHCVSAEKGMIMG